MNSRKANRLFLSVIILNFVVIAVLIMNGRLFSLGMVENLLISQMIIFLPGCISLLFTKDKIKGSDLGFCKIRISTLLFTGLYTLLCMPLVTLVNAVSMLLVDNTVVELSSEILSVPFPIMFVFMAIIGPFSEEFVFRGIIFNSYRRDGNTLGAVLLSAFVFGCMHMNLNQAGYAFVIGIALAFLLVATGSIWAPFFMHFLINAETVCMMYFSEYLMPGGMAAETETLTQQELLQTIGIYGVVSVFTTAMAVWLLYFIASKEGRNLELKNLLEKKENGKKRISRSLVVALMITIGYMALEVIATAVVNYIGNV